MNNYYGMGVRLIKKIIQDVINNKRYKLRQKKLALHKEKLLNIDELKRQKTSETIFLIGNSPSIFSITAKGWAEIKSCDSMGINGYGFNDFIPTYYSLELNPSYIVMHHFLLKEIERKYINAKTKFIINYDSYAYAQTNIENFPEIVKNNFSFVSHRHIKNLSRDGLKDSMNSLYIDSIKNKLTYNSFIAARASIFACVQLCWALGYKKICLPGVDLNNQLNFYRTLENENARKYSELEDIFWSYNISNVDRESTHTSIDNRFSGQYKTPAITQILKDFQDLVLNKVGVQIYAYSKESLLSSIFPVWKCDE